MTLIRLTQDAGTKHPDLSKLTQVSSTHQMCLPKMVRWFLKWSHHITMITLTLLSIT